ncbi:recombinase family protein [Alicyclobacillus fastidiosus]|uniref:Recombinase family protein n=1 Tax=Alicyclobacillus fastidiosus TaxID=392011 RepID=A0ABY6ZK78_9BACL|nr:recombinase family protein [Alicyclobacillus fastidiosus]WAH43257.1 recombinase family protein [Alicyclobacillus fastidiosus]GMA65301.1 hypothetical protein GCM10025859_57410 [Alicyclobacillus fastidiosus]
MRAVAYYRVSSDLQDHSLDMQKHMALLAAVKHDLVIEDVYDEEVCSARQVPLSARRRMMDLMDDIRAGKVTHVLVYKRDRMARKSHEYMTIYRLFKEHGVTVVFTADNEFPIHYDGVGDYVELIMSGLIEREGDLISKRIRDTKVANFLKGTLVGPLPYGYWAVEEKTKERLRRKEDELRIVREIFDMVITGKYDKLNDIRKVLNNKGYRRVYEKDTEYHKKGDIREWKVPDIEKILETTLYYGVHQMTFKGMDDPIRYPRPEAKIIERDLWEEAQRQVKRMNPSDDDDDEQEGVPITFYAKELVYCGICKEPLTTKIRHPKAKKTGFYECEKHGFRIEQRALEDLLLTRAKETFRSLMNSDLSQLMKRYREQTEARLKSLLQRKEKQLKDAKDTMLKSAELYVKSDKEDTRKNRIKVILEKHVDYDSINKSCEEIVACLDKLREIEQLPAYFHEQIQERLQETIRSEENTPILLRDVIARVDIFEYDVQIAIKHPFLQSKEVYADVASQ